MPNDSSKSSPNLDDTVGTNKPVIRSNKISVSATDWNNSGGGQLSSGEEAYVTYVSGKWYTHPHSDAKEADPQNWHGPGGNGVRQVGGNFEGALIVAIRRDNSGYKNEQEQTFSRDDSVIHLEGPGTIIMGCADDDRNDNLGTIEVLIRVNKI